MYNNILVKPNIRNFFLVLGYSLILTVLKHRRRIEAQPARVWFRHRQKHRAAAFLLPEWRVYAEHAWNRRRQSRRRTVADSPLRPQSGRRPKTSATVDIPLRRIV